MPSSYYQPCKELDRCVELNKYWDTDKRKWFEGYYQIATETHYPLAECQLGYCYLEGIGTEKDIINDLIYIFGGINGKYIAYDAREDAFILNKE